MNKEKFTFDLVDIYAPNVVISNSLKQIEKDTKGYVKGNIEKYDGQIYSYTKRNSGWSEALEEMRSSTETVSIQQDLGEQDSERNKFEVFLSVKRLEHYRYRMMFLDYGTISYPATIVMNEDLAVAYSGKRKEIFTIDSMKKLEEMMDIIFDSDMMVALIQSLINESLRHEMREIS